MFHPVERGPLLSKCRAVIPVRPHGGCSVPQLVAPRSLLLLESGETNKEASGSVGSVQLRRRREDNGTHRLQQQLRHTLDRVAAVLAAFRYVQHSDIGFANSKDSWSIDMRAEVAFSYVRRSRRAVS